MLVLLLPENNELRAFILTVFVYRFILLPAYREPLLGTFRIFIALRRHCHTT
jgi:hypothetical protein